MRDRGSDIRLAGPVRDRVPVNVTVPAVGPRQAHDIVARSGCRTAKVKVAEPGQSGSDDAERVEAVRDAIGPDGKVRIDANGGWNVDEATAALTTLSRFGLEYAEQPCATLDELAELRRRVDVPLAADESIRRAEDPLKVRAAGAADIVVLKAQPLGGVRAALDIAEACGLPVVVSSAVETSVGLAAGVALAAALPELDYACGLATMSLLSGDVSAEPLAESGGWLPVRAAAVDAAGAGPVRGGRGRLAGPAAGGGRVPARTVRAGARVNPSTAFATVLTDELIRCGLREAVVAPGSRSAPLALALHAAAAGGRLRLHVRVDERSASFLALGLAKAGGAPVAVVCTSGTAAAHFHAAVIEADESAVPLLVLTADRPPELRGTGANQTIDQIKLYGGAVRWFGETGVPEDRPGQREYWRSLASRAYALAAGLGGGLPGPVHLNLPFRDPLVPDAADEPLPDALAGRPDGAPWTRVSADGAVAGLASRPAGVGAGLDRARRRGLRRRHRRAGRGGRAGRAGRLAAARRAVLRGAARPRGAGRLPVPAGLRRVHGGTPPSRHRLCRAGRTDPRSARFAARSCRPCRSCWSCRACRACRGLAPCRADAGSGPMVGSRQVRHSGDGPRRAARRAR